MSGIVQSNILRSSGTIAVSAAGLNWVSDIVTASTVTVEAGNGYWINTTSNTCTITLPSAAESGDQIVIIDYARTWGTNKIIIDSNGLNYQGNSNVFEVEYTTDGQSLNIVYSDATKGWLPLEDDVVADEPFATLQKAAFAFGKNGSAVLSVKNLISSSGVVGNDVTGVGTARHAPAAASYGGDKGVFAYGNGSTGNSSFLNTKNLMSNSGVIAANVSGVGTARFYVAALGYGTDKAIFAYGENSSNATVGMSNLVNSSGVIGTDVTGVGTARYGLGAVTYGVDKGIFAFGQASGLSNLSNLVSNSGVIGSDVTGVGTVRRYLGEATYGGDKAIFGYGNTGNDPYSMSNKVSNVGVVATDVTGVGTARFFISGAGIGGDKGIFGYGTEDNSGFVSMTNLVSNTGVIAADVTGVGTERRAGAMSSYSNSA